MFTKLWNFFAELFALCGFTWLRFGIMWLALCYTFVAISCFGIVWLTYSSESDIDFIVHTFTQVELMWNASLECAELTCALTQLDSPLCLPELFVRAYMALLDMYSDLNAWLWHKASYYWMCFSAWFDKMSMLVPNSSMFVCFKLLFVFLLMVVVRVTTPKFKIESLSKIGWFYSISWVVLLVVAYCIGWFLF